MPEILHGRCECGAVEYDVADAFSYAMNCHCSNCRAGTGSAFKPFGGIERDRLAVTKGADTLLVWGKEDDNHTRCAICGSLLFSVVGPGRVHVAYGSLRDTPSMQPTQHIFVGSKAAWFEILDDLPPRTRSTDGERPGRTIATSRAQLQLGWRGTTMPCS